MNSTPLPWAKKALKAFSESGVVLSKSKDLGPDPQAYPDLRGYLNAHTA